MIKLNYNYAQKCHNTSFVLLKILIDKKYKSTIMHKTYNTTAANITMKRMKSAGFSWREKVKTSHLHWLYIMSLFYVFIFMHKKEKHPDEFSKF